MPEPTIEPPFSCECECCGRDTPTTICLDVEGNAVLLCIDCQEGDSVASFLGRCMHCSYTRHPCSTYELATIILALLDRGRTDV